MSNYQQNGQQYYSHGHPAQSQNSQYGNYGAQAGYRQNSLARTSSFDAGDDARHFGEGDATAQPGYDYGTGQAPPQPMYNQTSQPYRAGSQHTPLGGYQHQYQASPLPPPPPAQYNPAQYQQHNASTFQAQTYASPQSPHAPAQYQPYIPAAYSASSIDHRTSAYGNQSHYDAGYSASQQVTSPVRSTFGGYTQPTTGYGGYQHQSGPVYTNNDTIRYTISSAHAPPPPAHDSAVPMRGYSHSSRLSNDVYAGSQYAGSNRVSHPNSDVNRNSSFASRISTQSGSYASSPQPSIPTPPSRNLSYRSPQREDTYDRHPQGRSLPGVPSESESDNDYFSGHEPTGLGSPGRTSGYEDLMHDINTAIGGASMNGVPQLRYQQASAQADQAPDPLFASSSPHPGLTPDEVPTHVSSTVLTVGDTNINYGGFSSESDAEAAAGLAAMQAADEQEAAEEARRRSGSASLLHTQSHRGERSLRQLSSIEQSSDSDYAGYGDLSLAGGGYAADMHYGVQSNYTSGVPPAPTDSERLNARMGSMRSSGVSSEGRDSQHSGYESIPPVDLLHPFPAYATETARVDASGTGGLTEPSYHSRRLSYEDGDEDALAESRTSGSSSPTKDSLPDLFFHPGMSPNRPLPPPPSLSDPGSRLPHLIPAGTYTQQSRFSQYEQRPYPAGPDAYAQSLLTTSLVPRSTSDSSRRSAPRTEQPVRSKTDAERIARLAAKQQGITGRPITDSIYEGSMSPSTIGLDLPEIPRKRFNPTKLTPEQFKKCNEPWALSSVLAWIRDLADEETDLKEQAVTDAIVALFMNKVPNMNTTEAEALGDQFIKEMFASKSLVREEEWVKFGPRTMSGVLYQLSGLGCFSSKLHIYSSKGRCYSYHCMRTSKRVDLSLPSAQRSEDWVTYYKLKKDDIDGRDKKEIERQNVLHEVVTSEELFMSQLDVVRTLYRDQLKAHQPPLIPEKRLGAFVKEVFGQVDAVKKINEDHLLSKLKYRQNEQGPWIVGFSDIFREWIRRARSIFVEYATNYPRADHLIRKEARRNVVFSQFLDRARDDQRSKKLSWDSYLKSPITRMQRYILLLQTVYRNMTKDSEEKINLAYAIDEMQAATHECNSKLGEMERKMDMIELTQKLRLREGMKKEVELNLDHLGREIIYKGSLLRAGGKGLQWVETFAILFDHYLVLAKPAFVRDSASGTKQEVYDVSKVPIPMDLIQLESTHDPAVVKSSAKIAAVTTTVTPRGAVDPRLIRANTSTGPASLTHTNTNTSLGSGNSQSIVTTTVLDANDSKDEKIMYPFRLKHLGKTEVYTLFAFSAQWRQDWCEAILNAKTRHAEALHAQNAEPFRLRVLADTAFGYEGLAYPAKRIQIRGTPLDRAIQETEKLYENQGRPAPVCRAPVNCATVFNQPAGKLMCAIGTDYGVYISEYENSRGWTRAIHMQRVSQIAVLEEFNLFLLIADKALIAHHLDVVCPPTGTAAPPQNDASARRAPQKLSGQKDVGFFSTGRMKDRSLVFYKKRDGINSTFKVLEPILQKSTATRSRFLPSAARRGQTEFFREYDEFYIPADSYSINLFHSSLAISTARGVEVLTLDKKQPWSIPNLQSGQTDTQQLLTSIATRIKDLRPLGMFRLSEAEFLVTFEDCAVYVNKTGDISRSVVMEFVGRARSACLHGQYLILFNDDFVEIRDAMNGRLKQVIAGRDIRMLDDGGGGAGGSLSANAAQQQPAQLGAGVNGLGLQGFRAPPRTPKFVLQHPEYEKTHLIMELVLEDNANAR